MFGANVKTLASCRVLSSGVKLRGASGMRVVTTGRENVVVRVASKQAAVSTPMKEKAVVDKEVYDCVVVGAGISGLCTAQALATRHGSVVSNVLVTEARDRVGGNITTVQGDGFLWEEGPNSYQPNDSMLAAAMDSGLKDELVLGDPQSPRYVLWEGRLRPVLAGNLLSCTSASVTCAVVSEAWSNALLHFEQLLG